MIQDDSNCPWTLVRELPKKDKTTKTVTLPPNPLSLIPTLSTLQMFMCLFKLVCKIHANIFLTNRISPCVSSDSSQDVFINPVRRPRLNPSVIKLIQSISVPSRLYVSFLSHREQKSNNTYYMYSVSFTMCSRNTDI